MQAVENQPARGRALPSSFRCKPESERVACAREDRLPSTGRLIYEGDPVAHSDFIELVIKRYGDFAVDFREFNRQYDGSLREDYMRRGLSPGYPGS